MAPPAPPPALPDTPLEDITKNRQTLLFKGVNGVPTFDGTDPSRWSRFMDSLRTTVAAFPTVQHGVALVDLIDIPGLPGKLSARGLSDPPAELNGLFQVIIAALLTGAAHDVMTDAIRDPLKRSDGVHVLRTLQVTEFIQEAESLRC